MVSILFDILSYKKVASPLIRVEKKFLRNWAYRVSKEAEFCTDLKNVQKSGVWQKGKKFYRKTEFLKTWKFFGNQCKIPLLLIPFAPNFEEIFFQLL
jgi:hypothetical protein